MSQGSPSSRGTEAAPITWLFEPDSFAPIAKLSSGEQLSIITDHLGTPLLLTDAGGKAVWRAELDTYGKLRNLNGDKYACPFRRPGQYEDAETGLYYNRYRYYDPDAGQYTSQDPLGIDAGFNFYAYVQDPNSYVDPLGLYKNVRFKGTDTLYPTTGNEKTLVKIEMQGSRGRDFTAANKKAGFKKTPEGYTWHHVAGYDPKTGKCTMELVERSAHEATFPHSGSVSQFEQAHGVKYTKKGGGVEVAQSRIKRRRKKKSCRG